MPGLVDEIYAITGKNSAARSSCRNNSASHPRESKAFVSLVTTTPSISPSLNRSDIHSHLSRFDIHLVGACFSHQVRRAQQTLKRSGVTPPSFELFPCHRTARDVGIIDVSDLKLATRRRFE